MAKSAKDVVRFVEETWNAGKLDELDGYFSPDFVAESAVPMLPKGLEGAKMAHGMSMQAFPDRKTEILEIIEDGDKVAVRMRMTGTNKGGVPWFGAPANNNKVDVQYIGIYDVKKGKITGHRAVIDGFTMLGQLGVFTPPQMG